MARFTLPGRLKIRLMTTKPANLAAPTQAELNAGVDVVGNAAGEELADFPDWMKSVSTTPTPGYASFSVGNVPGDVSFPNISMTWYKDDTAVAIYDAVAESANPRYLAIMRDGQGNPKESQILTVIIQNRQRTNNRDGANQFRADMAVQAETVGTQAI